MSNTALTLQIGGDISKLRAEMNKANGLMGGFQKQMLNIGKMMAGVFAADKMLEFGKQVFNVTAEFQKFEAVLTNTLGNNGAAQAALRQINEFAAKTPYQVDELTASFVKLANQGFIPTMKQMTSLGDLASAMGKSFDQLTEAIIDAQTGEFERLKEFGIRASKQGDQVTFTFKGVKTQVDFTADSIRQYILSLGDVKGVTGGMDAQSKTLGGTMSNLSDAIGQVQLALGKLIEGDGLVSSFLNNFAAGAKKIAEVLGGPTKEELEKTLVFFKEVKNQAWKEKDMKTWKLANEAYQEAFKRLKAITEGEKALADIQENKTIPAVKATTQSVKELMDQWDRQSSIFSNKFDPASQIKNKTGGDFMFDSGAMVEMANSGANALRTLDAALKVNSTSWDEWWSGVQVRNQLANEDFQKFTENANRLAEEAQFIGESIGGVFEAIVSGQGNVIQAMIRATEQIVTMFLKQSIAAMIASHLKDPTTAAFPWAKIAAATAGIGIVKGLFAGLSGGMGGMSGGGGQVGVRPSEMNLNVSSRSRISGYHLELISEKESYRRSRVG